MSSITDKPPGPIGDSPWFWVALFSGMALVALSVIGPKYQQRQLLEERKDQGRYRGLEIKSGRAPTAPVSTRGNLKINLWPLAVVVGAIAVVSWSVLWWQRWRPGAPHHNVASERGPP